ncbi:hypothetical protein Q1695_000364 [Nippostrongylus brasiliensis]|nr:hypothetical protein Q1695_000364 [Nippostrongylus brasiliensis]
MNTNVTSLIVFFLACYIHFMLAFLIHHEAFVQSILQLLSYLYCQVTSICRFTSMKHILLFAALTSSVISAETQHQVKRSFPTYSEYSLRYAQRARANTGLAPGATCSSDANCAGYPLAYCDGVCRCTNEALNAGSTCIKAASQPLEACPSGQTYISEAGACMTGQYPGEPCQYSQQCAAMEPGAFCLQLRCECMYGMIRNGNGCTFVNDECRERGSIFIPELGECRQVLAPGTQSCSHNLQCAQAFPGATCFQQTCTCPSSFPEEVDGSCGKRCDLGNTYSSAAGQCLPRCQRNQIEVNGECLYQSAPGQSCRVNAQCTGGSSCLNDVCTCPRGMLPMGGTCDVARSPPMSSCRNGERCSRDAICVDGSCVCPPGRQIVNGQCVVAITGVAICVDGKCQRPSDVSSTNGECPPGTTNVSGICVTRPSASPGSRCSSNEICSGGSNCMNNICVCPAGQVNVLGECRVLTNILGSCDVNLRCTNGAQCDVARRLCKCPATSIVVDGACISITSVARMRKLKTNECGRNSDCARDKLCVNGRCLFQLGAFGNNSSDDIVIASNAHVVLARRGSVDSLFTSKRKGETGRTTPTSGQ